MTILQGPPSSYRTGHRDGHALELVIKNEHLRLQWVCPHQGVAFTSSDCAPTCRIGSDEGIETFTNDCIPGMYFEDLQADALTVDPTGDSFAVSRLPVHVEWWFDYGDELYVRPYLPQPTDPAPIAPNGEDL
jgi:hypothetical protein